MGKVKVVQLISGGLDSTVLAYDFAVREELVGLLSVNYGQIHKRELRYAEQTAMRLHVQHNIANLSTVNKLLAGSALTDQKVKVPEGHYAQDNMRQTIVPNRNAMMLSIAYAWALSLGADAIAFAAHAGDHAVYPDCREPFVEALEKAFNIGSDWNSPIRILSPYVHKTKADIVRRGYELNVPFLLTWTCYGNGVLPCGRCGTCVERLEAFNEAGIEDPWEYQDREFWRDAIAQHQEAATRLNAEV